MPWSRFFRRKQWDNERAQELEAYLEIETSENIARGMTAENARFAAHRKLGNPTLIREEIHRMNSIPVLDTFWQDLRFASRILIKNPGFTTVVVLSLALGIGANTAIFTLINAALLKTLPVRNPEQLIQLKAVEYWFPYPTFQEFRNRNQVLSGILAFASLGDVNVEINGHGGIANGQVVSGEYFSVLGVPAILGRAISPEDDRVVGAGPVAVLSYNFWQRRFGSDPGVIGRTISLNNSPFVIAGVTPPEFSGVEPGQRVDISIPISMVGQARPGWAAKGTPYYVFTSPVRNWVRIMARVKPSVTPESALANLEPIYRNRVEKALGELRGLPFDSPYVQRMLQTKLQVSSGGQGLAALRQQFSKPLWILMATVALLLLITCANVANLSLARGNARSKEMVVRLTVGAGRVRLVRQLITESVLLAGAGGSLGLIFAFWASRHLLALVSHSSAPIWLNVEPDWTVLGFTLLVSLITALFFGLVPAMRATQQEMSPALLESTRSMGRAGERSRMTKSLVVLQVALSIVLLVGAGLLARSLGNLTEFYPGFNKQNVLLVSVNPGTLHYNGNQTNTLYQTLLDRIAALPGVRRASFSMDSPLSGGLNRIEVKVEGHQPRSSEEKLAVLNLTGSAHFTTIETPIVRGRDFKDSDQAFAPKVAIINQTMAHDFFGQANPLGRKISIPGWVGDSSWFEIVGVVKDFKQHDLREPAAPTAYVPVSQSSVPGGVTFEIRTAVNPMQLSTAVLRAIAQTDPRLPAYRVRTLGDQLDDSLIQERLLASLSTVFGLLALLLAAVGLYSLMTYAVNRRSNEIGIRMALGAERTQITRMILRETLRLVVVGLAIGIPVSFGTSRLIQSELYGLKSNDPITIAAVGGLLLMVAIFAAYLPARRASRVDPITALRYE